MMIAYEIKYQWTCRADAGKRTEHTSIVGLDNPSLDVGHDADAVLQVLMTQCKYNREDIKVHSISVIGRVLMPVAELTHPKSMFPGLAERLEKEEADASLMDAMTGFIPRDGWLMTCESGGKHGPVVRISCADVEQAQQVHRSIIEIAKIVRQLKLQSEATDGSS